MGSSGCEADLMRHDSNYSLANSAGEGKVKVDFAGIGRTGKFVDERGRLMRLPNRSDYIKLLIWKSLLTDENEFNDRADLAIEVYLDWLRRGQVGCVFAQLLGRPRNRQHMHTVVLRQPIGSGRSLSLAERIDGAAGSAISDPNVESISILLPDILTYESLVTLILELSMLPEWRIEREPLWRKTLVLVGLRFQIQEAVWAEVLGLGPFELSPPTRQSPVTSLEIRTKPKGATRNKTNPELRAAHLARIPTAGFLSRQEHRIRFSKWTPRLRLRMLGGIGDGRAKARVTFALPAAMWEGLKAYRRYQPEATDSEGC